MAKVKRNYLLEGILKVFENEKRGAVADLGCGDGDYSVALTKMGFKVIACDLDVKRFKHNGKIDFKVCDVTKQLPFDDASFDFVVLAEVIEHLRNPYQVMQELSRILRPGGKIILSTPNILNLKSRMRFLFEGCWEFFREPPLENSKNPKSVIYNLHLIPWRYHELEYLLADSQFEIQTIASSIYDSKGLSFLKPLIQFQLKSKEMSSRKKGGLDYSRINKIVLSDEILYGRHLIIKAIKK
ncbi:MAG: class I SAM-dependent methyltransferase [Candidatus Omnitrophica bacterium]|nr:class I SAM-dependent methyltransferase [Candidatus Omnitrophota bacterium]